MKIALLGYGKMGKTIEEIALERGHEIVARVSSQSSEDEWQNLKSADVCIEFTRPEAALENFEFCIENKVPLVTGTTGWHDHMDEVKSNCENNEASFFWASNFSIGVNLFWQINKRLAQLMNNYLAYSPSMREIHHTQKLDEPSGTAITTAQQILAEYPSMKGWKLTSEHPDQNELPIEALRESDVKGTHIVSYDSEIDRIELKHEAKTRKGFALGAVLAAEFLHGKTGFYTMEDLLG